MTDRHAYIDRAPLAAGDTVAFVSPAGPGDEASLKKGVGYYREWGLEVQVGDAVLKRHSRARYLAGEDDDRRNDLVNAWMDPDVDAVVCTRGGYGALRLLDGIDWNRMREGGRRRDGSPKLLTGSSDITALHEAFRVHLDVPTLFCPMATNGVFAESEIIRLDVRRWLLEPWGGRELIGPDTEILAPGKTHGRFTGGNVSLLTSAIGAPEAAEKPDGILFLEDVGESPYRLDNFLTQMDRAGRFNDVTGIVLGSWNSSGRMDDLRLLMDEFFADRGVPVLWEQGFGHDPHALSVPLNVDGLLDASGSAPVLTVTGAAS